MTGLKKTASAGGGRFIPTKAEIAHIALGQFQITNFNSSINYSISVDLGSYTFSNGVLSLSNVNAIATIIPSSTKGGVAQTSSCQRKQYTYTTRTGTTSGTCCNTSSGWGSCGPQCGAGGGPNCSGGSGCGCYGNSAGSWGQCGCSSGPMCWYNWTTTTSCFTCTSSYSYQEKDSYSSSGFIDRFGEWVKIL